MAIRKSLGPLSGQYDPADPEELERPALETAFAVGRRLDAHVEVACIGAEPHDPRGHLAGWVPGMAIETLLSAIDEEGGKRQARARALFDAEAHRFAAPRGATRDPQGGFSVRFVEESGDIGGSLPILGRLPDLIVTACPPLEESGGVPPLPEVALRESGRPVLISRSVGDTFGERVAIAWKGSAEATRAVAFAMDFIVRASEVVLISVSEDGPTRPAAEDLAEYLAWRRRAVHRGGRHAPFQWTAGRAARPGFGCRYAGDGRLYARSRPPRDLRQRDRQDPRPDAGSGADGRLTAWGGIPMPEARSSGGPRCDAALALAIARRYNPRSISVVRPGRMTTP